MKIYTRTGDKGTTSLFSGKRIAKNNPFIEAIGSVDEGNSTIGFALSFLPLEEKFAAIREQLVAIQHALFDVGAALATPLTCKEEKKLEKTRFDHEACSNLEHWMDNMDTILPPLRSFILPGGHSAGAALHLARSVIRRAERDVIPLYQDGEVSQEVLMYLNRLSDYLFMVSRFINHQLHIEQTEWQPHSIDGTTIR